MLSPKQKRAKSRLSPLRGKRYQRQPTEGQRRLWEGEIRGLSAPRAGGIFNQTHSAVPSIGNNPLHVTRMRPLPQQSLNPSLVPPNNFNPFSQSAYDALNQRRQAPARQNVQAPPPQAAAPQGRTSHYWQLGQQRDREIREWEERRRAEKQIQRWGKEAGQRLTEDPRKAISRFGWVNPFRGAPYYRPRNSGGVPAYGTQMFPQR